MYYIGGTRQRVWETGGVQGQSPGRGSGDEVPQKLSQKL